MATDEDSHVHGVVIICFMSFGFLLGVVINFLLSRFAPNVPYTVVLFLVGICFAIWEFKGNLLVLGLSIHQWELISPEILLYMFLPALLFGEAMNLNMHNVKQTFGSALLLAGPGSLYGTFLLAALVKVIFPYNWSWPLCLVYGAILCATDPVAVVALLKQVGASPRLTMLITQEALLNDGVALVLYELFYNLLLIDPEETTPSSVAIYFVRVIFISPAFGVAMGLGNVGLFMLANQRMREDDVTIQVAMTLLTSYFSFFIAQYILHCSGVIACCAAGATIAWTGTPLILQHETMHSVWRTFEWVANTLLFLLAGLLFGRRIVYEVSLMEVLLVFVTYILIHIVRATMVVFAYPFMKYEHGITLKESIFLTWGGLRGAVGIALALILDQGSNKGINTIEEHLSRQVFFLVGGVATLTLIINATTSQNILYQLKLVELNSDESETMQHYVRTRIIKQTDLLLSKLKNELPALDEHLLNEFCPPLRNSAMFSATVPKQSIMRMNELQHTVMQTIPEVSQGIVDPIPLRRVFSSTSHHSRQLLPVIRSESMTVLMDRVAKTDTGQLRTTTKLSYAQVVEDIEDIEEASFCSKSDSTNMNIEMVEVEGKEEEDILAPSFLTASNLASLQTSNAASKKPKVLNDKLLVHVRVAFIEVLRATYWSHIDLGKLPRDSSAAIALLNSIDFAHDTVHTPGFQDWDALMSYMKDPASYLLYMVNKMDDVVDLTLQLFSTIQSMCNSNPSLPYEKFTTISNIFMNWHQGRMIYILSGFIAAHLEAQQKIPFYLGEEEVADTPEEAMVIAESQSNVKIAQAIFEELDSDVVSYHITKQVANIILNSQETMIQKFSQEGILRPSDAEVLLEEIHHNCHKLKREWMNLIFPSLNSEMQ